MPRTQPGLPTSFGDSEGTLHVTQETDDIVAISLEGEFDMTTSPLLVEQAERALDDRQHLILDLSDATFIDSSMLNAVLRTHRAATARGRVAVLQLGSAAVVDRVIALTGIERVLPRTDNRADAVRTIHELAAPNSPTSRGGTPAGGG
jgi:anti-sigma B factor antagonist